MTALTRQAYSQLLPRSVSLALSQMNHADTGPVLPSNFPSAQDIQQALRILAAKLDPIGENDAKRCFAKLLTTFEPTSKLGGPETKLRFAAWHDALKDIPADLWFRATDACIASLEWMPKPAQFRGVVGDELAERQRQLRMTKELSARESEEFVRESPETRLEGMIRSYRKIGNEARAIVLEAELRMLRK